MASDLKPSLPYPNSSLSYWHRTTRSFPLLNSNDTAPVPEESAYVIIGAGLTGALTAFSLLEAGIKGSDILIIEAREVVSGSTGRNAGHCRPDGFRNFNGYAARHGKEQALKIANMEDRNFSLAKEFINKHHIACEFTTTKTFDVCFSDETAEDESKNLNEYIAAGGRADAVQVYEGEKAREATGFEGATAAYEWNAAFLHPVKLAHWVLETAAGRGVRLWTHCPVTSISAGEKGKWVLQTPRGSIASKKVIHCTNSHAGVLLPQISVGDLVPIRGQVHALVPSRAHSGHRRIEASLALRTSLRNFYAVIQTAGDGTIIFTVARSTGVTFDETSYDEEVAKEAQERFQTFFPPGVEASSLHGEGLDHAWTGLLAFTPDKVPYVGEIPELPGQYICAGFNGHGISNIFAVVSGLVKLIQGGTWEETSLPECFGYSAERLKSRV
ncbi:FAD dependent oxidoreductase [Clohesyomyces aquaticus]|uniref:FAD dependent oxidoreductase n=1 Tax=Clohesyomyces aquaticus TaxID=1231657 RepID=A0A1Y1ZEA4_9PLEO|nr:FAD dependent oxidoreductase [Clohesyomyces aquaticus]